MTNSTNNTVQSPPAKIDIKEYQDRLKGRAYGHVFSTYNKAKGCLFASLVICLVTAVAFMLIMSFTGNVTNNFYQDLIHFVHQINPKNLAIGLSVTAVLVGGGIFVIHHVRHHTDPLIESDFTHLPKKEDIVEIGWTYDDYDEVKKVTIEETDFGYMDKSTLKDGKGKAYVYIWKPVEDHYSVSAVVTISSPLYAAATLIYDTIRLVIIPFYVSGCLLVEKCTGKSLFKKEGQRIPERNFEAKDIGRELALSLFRIVKAPFYGVAFFFAALYTLINPAAGRTLAAAIERSWNEDVARAEGFWSVGGPQELWDGIEGGGGPNHLGRNGFYLAGCWQPIGVVEFFEDDTVYGCSLSEFIQKQRGHVFKAIFTSSSQFTVKAPMPELGVEVA